MIDDSQPPPPGDLERIVDELEARVLGQVVDQSREHDNDDASSAFEQDLDEEPPATGAASEPSS